MTRFVLLSLPIMLLAHGAELPVRQVVLYKHGVGYFERSGDVAAGEAARLDFKASEMNDVLKSLTIEDKRGNSISGVRYDSSEPLSGKLVEFPFQLGERQALSTLIDSLKGARIDLRTGPETISGAVVGARLVPATQEHPEREQITLLLDSGALRTFDLSTATEVRFRDAELQNQIRDYLAAMTGARSREQRSVYIDSADSAARQLFASYVIPVPVWKSSYRLVFGATGEPLLEGWAIIDNVTSYDWSKVRLSLVSGRPISFVSKLYEPRYISRPTAELPEERAQAPVVHEGAIGGAVEQLAAAPPAPAKRAFAKAGEMRTLDLAASASMAEVAPREEIASTIAASAESRELGELFEYSFSAPVTVKKGESAMLPFLQQKITARKLLIYADQRSQHPTNAAEITNNTGKTLDGGPVTVFDSAAYGGEALMETLKASDRRLISYGVDLGTRITTQFDSGRQILREVHFRRGVLTSRHAVQETRTYTIRNVDQKPKTLIVEHPVRPEYKLINAKPAETTATAYRFEVKLAPGANEKFPVVEERVFENVLAIVNLTPDVLASYVQNKELNEGARKQLERILHQKRLIAEVDQSIQAAEQQTNDLSRDQERLRQNINSLRQVTGQQEQVQEYARQLAANEIKLAGLRDQSFELRKKKAALESELNSLIEKMEF